MPYFKRGGYKKDLQKQQRKHKAKVRMQAGRHRYQLMDVQANVDLTPEQQSLVHEAQMKVNQNTNNH